MDRRTVLAIGLMLVVAILPSLFIKRPEPPPPGAVTGPDSAAVAEPAPPTTPVAEPEAPAAEPVPAITAAPVDSIVESEQLVTVESPLYRFVFSTRGARLVEATMKQYRSFATGDSGLAQLIPVESNFFEHSLLLGDDTISLADWNFEPSAPAGLSLDSGQQALEWVARRGSAVIRLTQTFRAQRYEFGIQGRFSGVGADAGLVLVRLGPQLRMVEADSTWDYRSFAVVTKDRSTDRTDFNDVEPGERADLPGPFEWVAVKTRYFVCAVLTLEPEGQRIGGAAVAGKPRDGKVAKQADVMLSLAAPGGQFAYSVYLGPQEFRRLARRGHALEDVNPYGWIFRPIIRPIAAIVAQILVWMHQTLSLGYGWVLILFGVAVRLLLWPLNQKAMRSTMAMQAIQPEIKALQDRHKKDPQRLQQEQLKLYREHGVNPLGGCLPMLIPMPVLFALFFVFRETIEFRGVPFLWLPDLSREDPFYIIPVVMGLSMFALSKIGQIGVQPNPQTKIMVYFMPIMMTVLFLKFSSGLNLYYAVSNITSLPQQWMIAHQRLRQKRKKKSSKPEPPGKAEKPTKPRKPRKARRR